MKILNIHVNKNSLFWVFLINSVVHIVQVHLLFGKIVSGEAFVSDCNLRDLIIKEHSPHCVEMEGSAIAHVAYINNISFLIIRSISDNADDDSDNYINFEKIASNNSAILVLNILDILNEN
jgi:adenosylhomocysteine nucleosidase